MGAGPLAGALFFAVTLSPVLGFVYHDYMEYSVVADRFQYLAGIGVITVFIGAAVHGASRLSGGLKLGTTGLMVVLLALLGTATWRQAGIYRDEVTFFSHIVSLNPKARSAHYNLSIVLDQAGRPEEALAAARMAVEKRPDHADAYAILGAALIRTERFVEAEEILRRALEIDPGHKYSRRQMALDATGSKDAARKRSRPTARCSRSTPSTHWPMPTSAIYCFSSIDTPRPSSP